VAVVLIGLLIASLVFLVKISGRLVKINGQFKELGEIMFTKALNYAKREDMKTEDPRRARLLKAREDRIKGKG
jgi:hypothetical protein